MKGKLRYGDSVIPYDIIQTKRKKTLQIFVEKDTVEVRAPSSKHISEIKKILKNRTRWIFNTQLKLKETKTDIKLARNSLLYLGKNIPVTVIPLQKKDQIIFKQKQFLIYTKAKSLSKNKIKKIYNDWLITKFTPYLEKKISLFSRILNVKPKGFQIKNLKSKWGSATTSGQIHLNLQLLKTPKKIIDYMILHELAHLQIKGHRHEFWVFLGSFMPDYEKRKTWLAQNGTEILKS